MQSALNGAIRELAITAVAFGDLFLEDVRAYREEQMATCGLESLFPLWGSPTDETRQDHGRKRPARILDVHRPAST